MHKRSTKIAILLALLLLARPSNAQRSAGSIGLTANPASAPADGKSVLTVSAEVRDQDGSLVSDGTEVRFSATLGIIEESGETSAGVARVRLVSSDIPGSCVITAMWVDGQAVAQTTVEFGDVQLPPTGPSYISVEADEYLAYSVDHKTLEALGDVRVRYRHITLEAGEVQIDLGRNRVLARGRDVDQRIKVTTPTGVIEGEIFTCDLSGFHGLLLSVESGVRRLDLSKSPPAIETEQPQYAPEELDFADLSDSQVLIRARAATLFPAEKIQFRRANVYVDGKRMLSLPLYALSLTGYQVEGEQYVGYSTGGLTLNLPLYYSLTPSSSGALLVRHGESSGWGWYGQKPGWFLDLSQRYATERSRGAFTISQVTGADWGTHLSHNQQLDRRTNAYLYVDYPAHRDLYGMLNVNRYLDNLNVSLNVYGSRFAGGEDTLATEVSMQTRAKPVGKTPFRYTLSTRAGYSNGSGSSSDGYSQSVQANMYSSSVKLSSALTVRGSMGLGYLWGDARISGLSSQAAAVLDCKFSPNNWLQLSYRFSERAGIYSSRAGKQSLSAMWLLGDGRKWRASVFAVKGLDLSTTNLFTDFSYRLNHDWRLGVRSTLNQYGSASYSDTELALGRSFGNRELMVVWSKSRGKLMLELGSSGF